MAGFLTLEINKDIVDLEVEMFVESINQLSPKEQAELEKELEQIRERFKNADQRKLIPCVKRDPALKLRWTRRRR